MKKDHKMGKIKLTTPKGSLQWVFIDGEGSYNDLSEKFEYKATLRLPTDSDEAKALMQKLDTLWAESKEKVEYDKAYEEAKPALQAKFEFHKGYTILEDDDGVPTGDVDFRFKTGTHFKSKVEGELGKPVKIQVYNAQAKKVELGDTKIGNDSIGRISGSAISWARAKMGSAGISLYLSSVQIIVLEEYTQNDFEDEGYAEGNFSDETNEFSGIEEPTTNTDTTDTEPSDNAGL